MYKFKEHFLKDVEYNRFFVKYDFFLTLKVAPPIRNHLKSFNLTPCIPKTSYNFV